MEADWCGMAAELSSRTVKVALVLAGVMVLRAEPAVRSLPADRLVVAKAQAFGAGADRAAGAVGGSFVVRGQDKEALVDNIGGRFRIPNSNDN